MWEGPRIEEVEPREKWEELREEEEAEPRVKEVELKVEEESRDLVSRRSVTREVEPITIEGLWLIGRETEEWLDQLGTDCHFMCTPSLID